MVVIVIVFDQGESEVIGMPLPTEMSINSRIMVWGTANQVIPLLNRIDSKQPVCWAYRQEQPVPGDYHGEVHWGENLLRIDGSCGEFSIQLGTATIVNAGTVALFPEEIPIIKPHLKDGQSVALLLGGTRRGIFARALSMAIDLAAGHTVYVIADDIQVAYPGGEDLFAQARNQGVVFFRVPEFHVINTQQEVIIDLPSLATELIVDQLIDYRASFDNTPWPALFKLGPVSVSGLLNTRREGIYVFPPSQELAPSEEALLYQALANRLAAVSMVKPVFRQFASIDNPNCALCLTCFRTCPHQAISLQPGKSSADLYNTAVYINPAACKGCGGCSAACPARAIKWDVENTGSPYILACENSGWDRGTYSRDKVRQYPCASAISNTDILETIANYGRVTIYACREGSCRHLGNAAPIEIRLKRLSRFMEQLGIVNAIEIIRKSAAEIDYQRGEGPLVDCR